MVVCPTVVSGEENLLQQLHGEWSTVSNQTEGKWSLEPLLRYCPESTPTDPSCPDAVPPTNVHQSPNRRQESNSATSLTLMEDPNAATSENTDSSSNQWLGPRGPIGSSCSQPTPNAPDKNDLKVLYYNVRSIVYKIDELSTNYSLYCPDIVCITETWLNEDVLDSEICIPNYQLVRLDQDRHGGGIALYIANYLSYSLICSGPDTLEFLAISIKQPQSDMAIALLYRPPSSPISSFDNLSTVLEDICIPTYSMFLLVGDYNVDISIRNHLSHNLLNVTDQHGLTVIRTDV